MVKLRLPDAFLLLKYGIEKEGMSEEFYRVAGCN